MDRKHLYERTETLLGAEGMERLRRAHVLVFGIGGVGSYAVEALARSGIGALTLVDGDTVSPSNINRQLVADLSTLGQSKAEVARRRIALVNPDCAVTVKQCFYLPQHRTEFDFSSYQYIIDAVDTVSAKLSIIEEALAAGVPVISSMGTGNKLHPEALRIADLSKTAVCPLARVMRTELRKRGILHVPVVYSEEPPRPARDGTAPPRTPASVCFVPAAAGMLLAARVVRELALDGES